MSGEGKNNRGRTPDRDAARALAVLARLPRAVGSETARQESRLAFLNGTQVKPSLPARRSVRSWAPLLAAAVLGAVLVGWFGFSPQEQWVVLDVVDPEGISIPVADQLVAGLTVPAGPVATGPGSELEVQLGSRLRLRMLPGSELNLPRPPGRWFGRNRRLILNAGEFYGTSGGQQLGFDLVFATAELEARLTGTTFAVFRTPEASCVCLWQGGIVVRPLVGPDQRITLEQEQRVWVYKDGRQPELLPLSGMEQMKLQMTHDAGLADPPRNSP